MTENFITVLKPEPSPYKERLRRAGIPMAVTARHLSLSYNYVSNLLNGAGNLTTEKQKKIDELIQAVESGK